MVAKSPEYLVSHGKTGALGRFVAVSLEPLSRGETVVVQSDRGVTLGVVLCEATERQARLLGAAAAGKLLRRADADDETMRQEVRRREQALFDAARDLAAVLQLPMEILDVELSLDGRRAILQYLLAGNCD